MNEFCSSDCELKGILVQCHAVFTLDLGALTEVNWVHFLPREMIASDAKLLQDV